MYMYGIINSIYGSCFRDFDYEYVFLSMFHIRSTSLKLLREKCANLLRHILTDMHAHESVYNDTADGSRQRILGWNDNQDKASGLASALGQLVFAN